MYGIDNLSNNSIYPGSIYTITTATNILNWGDAHALKDVSVIFHLGEYSRVTPSFKDFEKVLESNLEGTSHILKLWKETNCKLVYAGSSTKFYANNRNESPYAFTKYVNSELIKNMGEWYGLNYSICYFNNVYGPNCRGKLPGFQSVIDIFHKQKLEGKPLTITYPGTQRRSFTSVWDTVSGIYKASKITGSGEYDLRGPATHSILEIAKMFSDNIEMIPMRPGDRADCPHYDPSVHSILDWYPVVRIEDYIESLCE